MYEMYEMYESTLSQPVFPLIPLTHNGSAAQKYFRSPLLASTYDGLTYDRANSSTLQATTVCGAYGRVVVSYQWYEYNDDLSERLPVINNTNAKMTCVVDNLCRQSPMWSIYMLEVSSALVSICVSFICRDMRFIILKRHLVTRNEMSVECNQTSSLVKSSASSSVLVGVYWLDDEGSPSICHRYWSGFIS